MRKRGRKLTLSRETLRNLQSGIQRVRGGACETTGSCMEGTHCDCPSETGCPDTDLMTWPCTLATRCVC
jgi:hypothetical protein